MKVNIAVLNYNGKQLLKECLPSIIKASGASRFDTKVTLLDNCSTDGSIDFVQEEFSQVEIYRAKENRVYCSYNEFCQSIDDDIIVILNSDIKVDEGFLDPMVGHFKDSPEVFFVSSRMYFFDGTTYQGDRSKASERLGVIYADTRFEGYERLIGKKGYTFSTGNGAFDRKKFLELGGFDDIYLPGRYEDVDLCFRGWKSGYKGIYEPRSIIYHKGYGSFKDVYNDREIDGMVFRNSLLFTWKNITGLLILCKFYFWLIPRLSFFLLTGRPYFIKAFWTALLQLPAAVDRRKVVSKAFKLRDKEVLDLIG